MTLELQYCIFVQVELVLAFVKHYVEQKYHFC